MKRDLTTGNIYKNLWVMSIPSMLGYMAQMVYDLADIFWIGKLSGNAVAGVTIFTTVFWLFSAFNGIIGKSSVSIISQKFGAKDHVGAKEAIEQTFVFKWIVALISTVFLIFFIKPIVNMFSSDKTVIEQALSYGYIRIFFQPIMFSSFTVNTALRCLGNAKLSMNIMFVVSIINIILDPLFMFETIPFLNMPGLGMGVFGAGLATVISQTMAFLIGFIVLFSGKAHLKPRLKGLLKINWQIGKKLLTVGLPSGIETFLHSFSGTVVMFFVSSYGTAVVAAVGIVNRIVEFAFMPLVGLELGSTTIVGQNLGAENIKRAEKTAHASSLLSVVFMSLFVFISFMFGDKIVGIFSNDIQIIEIGSIILKYGSSGLAILAIGFGISPVFSGSGYNLPFLIASIVAKWVVQIPILFLFVHILKVDLNLVWFSIIFANATESIIYIIFYKKGKWKNKRVY